MGKEVEEEDKVGWRTSPNTTTWAWDKWDEGEGENITHHQYNYTRATARKHTRKH